MIFRLILLPGSLYNLTAKQTTRHISRINRNILITEIPHLLYSVFQFEGCVIFPMKYFQTHKKQGIIATIKLVKYEIFNILDCPIVSEIPQNENKNYD